MNDLKTLIARSIGRTIHEKNHMRRADDVLNTIDAAGFMVVSQPPSRLVGRPVISPETSGIPKSVPKLDCTETTASTGLRDTEANATHGGWDAFTNDYQKRFYDVKIGDEIVPDCWPNAGKICATDGSGREWGTGECLVRPTATHPAER